MNNTSADAVALVEEIKIEIGHCTDVTALVCPPCTSLESVARVIEDSNIQLGAQNMHHEPNGAYTGEISAGMLRHLFCAYVILGHSERRAYFSESDTFINKKVLAALENNLKPVFCVGESLDERENGKTSEVVESQVREGLASVVAEHSENLVVAYEPVWAIGTGLTATPEMAQEVHAGIRRILEDLVGSSGAARVRILYGGSMKPDNASDLLAQPDIDGGLIGGASLEARSFVKLVEIALAS